MAAAAIATADTPPTAAPAATPVGVPPPPLRRAAANDQGEGGAEGGRGGAGDGGLGGPALHDACPVLHGGTAEGVLTSGYPSSSHCTIPRPSYTSVKPALTSTPAASLDRLPELQ